MTIPIYGVDAFTDKPFSGNPAAVCILEQSADEGWMQSVATEMNLSETAFTWPLDDGSWSLRWFTPVAEIDLCGHATLATAHIMYETGRVDKESVISFRGTVYQLSTSSSTDGVTLDFPIIETEPIDVTDLTLFTALGLDRRPCYQAGKMLLLLCHDAAEVASLSPDFSKLKAVDAQGVIVTARGEGGGDFVSRFFAPSVGINEDPVTGSAHCALAHFWEGQLGKNQFSARQISKRGGSMIVRRVDQRVRLTGNAITMWQGMLLS